MKKKAEYVKEVAFLQSENERLRQQLDAEKKRIWAKQVPIAMEKIAKELERVYGCLLCMVRFEHVDEAGFWFTYELTNDSRRQTYCVRHDVVA